MSAYNKFNAFVADQNNGNYNLGADTLKVLLTNVAPVAANAKKSDLTEIAAGHGYAAGGAAVTVTSSTQAAGTYKLIATNTTVFTNDGTGNIGPWRYAVLYDATADGAGHNSLIAWWDYGSSNTSMQNGDNLVMNWDAVNGIFNET